MFQPNLPRPPIKVPPPKGRMTPSPRLPMIERNASAGNPSASIRGQVLRYEAGLEAARALIADWVGSVGPAALSFLKSLLIRLWVTLSVWEPPIAGLSRGVFVVPIRAL